MVQKMTSRLKDIVGGSGCEQACRDVPRHSTKYDQIGLLLVVSYDSILHVTERRHIHTMRTNLGNL